MAKLSVIVCVYNTDEQLFKQCLDSIYDSTLKDIEVIVVDDGSTKDYSKILKSYRNLVYIKTQNQGTLKARMCGIEKANASYVCFADSDDIVSFDYYEAGIVKAEKLDAGIIFNDWAFFTSNSRYILKKDSTIREDFYIKDEQILTKYFKSCGREHSYHVLWNKIYKREILAKACDEIKKLDIQQKLCFAEDVLINYFAFKNSSSIANVHLGHYFYRIHSNQQIAADSEEKLKYHILSTTLVFSKIQKDLEKINRFDELKINFEKWKQMLCYSNYSVAKRAGYKNLFEIIKKEYGVNKLKTSPLSHSKIYSSHKLLPQNFDEIENQLKKIYYSNRYLKIFVNKKSFAYKQIIMMKKLFKKRIAIAKYKKDSNFFIKREKYSLKQRLLHNVFVYKLGMFFVPKGSKLRNRLKAKI